MTPQGSPGRSRTRTVFADTGGKLYAAEGFEPEKQAHRAALNLKMEFLARQGAAVTPYLRTAAGGHGAEAGGIFFQVRPWTEAQPAPRENIGDDRNFGKQCGEFLLRLKDISRRPDFPPPERTDFNFADYLPALETLAKKRMPEILPAIAEITDSIRDFLEIEPFLPKEFAHGDFHPANILMRNGSITAVIDWEFCGRKTAGYDAALMLGCLGIDNPGWLNGPAAAAMLEFLKEHDCMKKISREYLPQLTAAVRLGWLGEWIECGDLELIRRELEFSALLRSRTAELPL